MKWTLTAAHVIPILHPLSDRTESITGCPRDSSQLKKGQAYALWRW